MTRRQKLAALCGICLIWVASPALAESCRPDSLEIRGAGVQARFDIELAISPAEQSKGLMYRESMPQFSGMLFIYNRPQSVSFWMKNTVLSLDMLFIDARGVVRRIHQNAVPLSTEPIPGGSGIQYVLEINAGVSAMLGLGEGSEIRYSGISQENAAWPCE